MKICYVNKGINVHDQKILKYFADNEEFDVHLLSFYGKKLPDIDGVHIHQIPIPSPELAFPIASTLTPLLIRKIKPDLVHGNYLLTYGFFAALAHYHPLLQMAWGSDVLINSKNRVYRPIVKYSLRHADLVTVDCEELKRGVIDLGCPEDKITKYLLGVDFNIFNPNIKSDNIRKELGWENNTIVVCTRNHELIYGIEYILQAIPKVIEEEKDARFLFIGSGRLTNKLKQTAKVLNIEKYVKFVGTIANDELGKYLTASDIYVSTSLSDGPSVARLEAMACGLPMVLTNIDTFLEWIHDGVNGFIVPKRDSNMLAEKISIMIEDKNIRESFGKRNYKIAKKHVSLEKNMKMLEDTYNILIEK